MTTERDVELIHRLDAYASLLASERARWQERAEEAERQNARLLAAILLLVDEESK